VVEPTLKGLDYVQMPLVSELFVLWDHRVKIHQGAGASVQSHGTSTYLRFMEFLITNYMKLNVMGENLIKIYGIFKYKLHESQWNMEKVMKFHVALGIKSVILLCHVIFINFNYKFHGIAMIKLYSDERVEWIYVDAPTQSLMENPRT
jgi:hypothetical protein